ncbi:MAG: hypothetical protein N2045_05490 [Fimbriimonadales bacterium]|nr:hypothetical protein [Armatimonadota bacterium]MCX7687409.1 hypothetical protein [Fimbriimonadales bacterium]CUU37246.1 type IV pilus assembly protein PilQ [Armatimonadetes bacterium DC]
MRNSWFVLLLTACLLGTVYPQKTFDLELEGVPLGMALQTLARQAEVNIVLAGGEDLKVNAILKNVRVEQALEILLKPLGLEYRLIEGCYVVGKKDQLAVWDIPAPQNTAPPQPPVVEVYTVRFVSAANLLTTLQQVHPDVKVLPGVPSYSPQLTTTGGSSGGIGASSTAQSGTQSATPEATESARTLLLYGPADRVAQALETAKRLDQPPMQIRIEVTVSDMSRNALKELGLDYTWSKLSLQEIVRTSEKDQIANETLLKPFDTSTVWRAPLGFEATLKALEQRGAAKLLANPSISVLNGESAQILIGDRVLYPVVSGTTTAGTPLFDVREQQVGIVLVVRAYAEPEGTITLDIYPQVSVITGFLRVGDSSFPQIATRELRTKIRVKDGTTIALGGLIREEEVRTLSQVPILGNLPVLGELFKSRRKSTVQNELVIFLKPEILRE